MSNKLQELTEKLYAEGLDKGKKEAEEILSQAKQQAENIIKQAKQQAEEIAKQAEKQAAEMKVNSEAEIQLAARRAISELKQTMERLVTFKVVNPSVKSAFEDKEFVQGLIKTAVSKFNPNNDNDFKLDIVLPEADKNNLAAFVKEKVAKELSTPIEVKTDSRIASGFKAGPADGSYYLSFTDADFDNLFKSYLRPQINELLFD